MIDVLVAGGGPAGWAVAAACARLGLVTELVDLAPDRPWRATYGSWRAELPSDIDPAVAAAGQGEAIGTTTHQLGWEYVVLNNTALRGQFATAPVMMVGIPSSVATSEVGPLPPMVGYTMPAYSARWD